MKVQDYHYCLIGGEYRKESDNYINCSKKYELFPQK